MSWTSGGCESGADGQGPLGNMTLRLLERAVVAALEHMEAAEEYLAACQEEVFRGSIEKALLRQKTEAIAEEVRGMRDRVAKVAGRMEQAWEKEGDGRQRLVRGEDGAGDGIASLTRRGCLGPWSG